MFLIIAKTVSASGQKLTQMYQVAQASLKIGRGIDNDLRLEHPSVQLRHAVIQSLGRAYVLRDLNYVSLTAVNDEPVKEIILGTKGTIRIGPYTLGFSRSALASTLTIEYEEGIESEPHVSAPQVAEEHLMAQTVPPTADPDLPPEVIPVTMLGESAQQSRSEEPASPAPSEVGDDTEAVEQVGLVTPPESMGKPDMKSGTIQDAPPSEPVADVPGSYVPSGRGSAVDLIGAYRLHGWFFNKVTLAVAGVLLVVGIASLATHFGKRTVFMPGAVSAKHASFVNECVRCHNPAQTLHTQVSDARCESCHKLPTHFGDRSAVPTPACTTCHLVHKGSTMLASNTGRDCLRCHADLKVKDATAPIARSVTDFTHHPEFSVMVQEGAAVRRVSLNDDSRVKDGSRIKLNHRTHLDPDLPGLEKGPLQCASCHQPAQRQAALMPPVKYAAACVHCHALDFDSKHGDWVVPHGLSPAHLEGELKSRYAQQWLVERTQAGGSSVPKELWVQEQVDKAKSKLFGQKASRPSGKCLLCHFQEWAPGARDNEWVPVITKTAIPERWLLNGNFDHAAHTMSKCIDCHGAALRSEATGDVLLPKVSTCRQCHNDRGSARTTCLECHLFHETPPVSNVQIAAP